MTAPGPQHAAPRSRATRIATAFFVASLAVLVTGGAVAVTAAVSAGDVATQATLTDAAASRAVVAPPEGVEALPVPTQSAAEPVPAPCERPAVADALRGGDDGAVVAAFGGGEAMREAVASGVAPCVDLGDPARVWVVANKAWPLEPIDARPPGLEPVPGVRMIEGGSLRTEAGAAMASLVAAAREAGAGEIAVESAYRSYSTQRASYTRHVAERGVDGADLVSARPGHSEHQTGLAADVVACDGSCTGLDGLAGTPQGEWVAAHAWEHGWIVRYVEGETPVTGYLPEPWHLRYLGPELARAYHAGGFTTLEAFWGLPPAPEYPG